MQKQKPCWMWLWGDYEVHHSLMLHSRRQELGHDYPTIWHTDAPKKTVQFRCRCHADRETVLTAVVRGRGYVMVDGVNFATGQTITLMPGDHDVSVRVTKPEGLPTAFVDCDAHYAPVGCEPRYEHREDDPEVFPFSYQAIAPQSAEQVDGGVLYDFGRETFGQIVLENADPQRAIGVYYGESREEALDTADCILRETVQGQSAYRLASRAFRYIYVTGANDSIGIHADYEYLPLDTRGAFRSSDELLTRIWDTAAYTFHLNSREFFLDGIKRDRWVWSGDAYQSYLVNNYLFFDQALTRRTIIALRGHDPVTQHINTILDYSLYWIISLWEYYFATADLAFVRSLFPKMRTLLQFCEGRTDENGFLVGLPGDWVFIDWSELDKDGAHSAEQMLYIAALEAMGRLAGLLGEPDADTFLPRAAALRRKVNEFYWKPELGAFIDSYSSGRNLVTRHANIFAIRYGIADEGQRASILSNVLQNDKITAITTPYFKFYELDVLCSQGHLQETTDLLRDYWGGMLKLGATTIWEQYIPQEQGVEHLAMYGFKYGRSLCHAWGGGPIYLLGRYYLGVSPTGAGYESFLVEPNLGGLPDISGTVPLPQGEVRVAMDAHTLRVMATCPGGVLRFAGGEHGLMSNTELVISY